MTIVTKNNLNVESVAVMKIPVFIPRNHKA